MASRAAVAAGFALGAHATDPSSLLAIASGRYDANWYRVIAAGGYTTAGPYRGSVGFYPGYPLIARLVALFIPDLRIALLLVTNIALALACFALYRLYAPRWGARAAVIGAAILICAPAGLFLGIGFSESAFLAAVAGAFLFADRQRWILAGLCGAAACAIRFNGALLAIPLFIAAYQARAWRAPVPLVVGIVIFALGAAAFPAYLGLAHGNPLLYVQAQAQLWHHHLVDPLHPIRVGEQRMVSAIVAFFTGRSTDVRYVDAPAVAMDGFMLLVAGATVVFGWRRLPLQEWVWVLLVVLPPLIVFSVPDSMARYLLAAFPIYFLVARLFDRFPAGAVVIMAFGLAYQGELAFRLAQGYFVA